MNDSPDFGGLGLSCRPAVLKAVVVSNPISNDDYLCDDGKRYRMVRVDE